MSPKKGLRTAVLFLCWEGAFAMAYETWIGPAYLAGMAGELGVNVRFVALVTALPFIGSMGQLISVWALHRLTSVKRYTLALALAARALWILPPLFALLFYLHSKHQGTPFPAARWFTIIAGLACGIALLASSSGVAWNSWMLGLIPIELRGRFFGLRQRYAMGAVVVANLIGALWIGWKPHGFYAGYAVISVLAVLAAGVSTFLLSRVPDVAKTASTIRLSPQKDFWQAFLQPLRDPKFRKVVLFGAAFTGAIQIAGPYFPYFYTKELHLPMSTVAFWIVGQTVGSFLSAGFWGRRIDKIKDAVPTLFICGNLMAVSPLIYTLHNVALLRWLGPI